MAYSVLLSTSLMLAAVTDDLNSEKFQSNGWRLPVRTDNFNELTTCQLVSVRQSMWYQPGALVFNVGDFRGTSDAWFRVDGGLPTRWQDKLPLLISTGVDIDGSSLDNAGDSWVWLPIAEVSGGHFVEIREDRRSRVRRFELRGFHELLDAARRLGCTPDDTFRT